MRVLVPTDIVDPMTGNPLYALVRVRPRWYRWLHNAGLFLSFVWRRYETGRISWATAWEIAFVIIGEPL